MNRSPSRSGPSAWMHPGSRGGFTLIEMLIALLVMMIGLLGVLSMFPVSLDRVRETAEFSEASVLSSSVHQSLASGFHRAETKTDGTNTYTVVTLHHAGLMNWSESPAQTEKYTFYAPPPPTTGPVNSFWLPCPEGDWGSGEPACPDENPSGLTGVSWGYRGTGSSVAGAKAGYVWQLGQENDGHDSNDLHDLIRDIRGEDGGPAFDPGFHLDRYSFSFLIRKRKASVWPDGFYQVLIRVYHNFRDDGKVPRTIADMPGGETHPNLVREYRTMISR